MSVGNEFNRTAKFVSQYFDGGSATSRFQTSFMQNKQDIFVCLNHIFPLRFHLLIVAVVISWLIGIVTYNCMKRKWAKVAAGRNSLGDC